MLHTLSELPGLNFSKSQREHPRHELTLRIMAWKLPMPEISRSCSVAAAVKSNGPKKLPPGAAIPRRWRWHWRALTKARDCLLAGSIGRREGRRAWTNVARLRHSCPIVTPLMESPLAALLGNHRRGANIAPASPPWNPSSSGKLQLFLPYHQHVAWRVADDPFRRCCRARCASNAYDRQW